MKVRDSGMPDEQRWTEFFDPPAILARLGLTGSVGDAAEFGCGYGTFTIPAARIVAGTVFAFDIEPEMIAVTGQKAESAGLGNVRTHLRDFVELGTGLPDASVDYAMLFNILHAEDPVRLLKEAYRVLVPGSRAGIIHWNYDPSSPRGPSLDIRPRPEQCCAWAEEAGFSLISEQIIDLPPYHYGIVLRRPH